MAIMKEFKEFAVKGNAFELAVGLIIGAEFGKIVSSLVSDIIMPPIGKLIGGVDFSSLFISLNKQTYESIDKAKEAGAPTLNYGIFLNNVFNFIIIAFAIFFVVKLMNRLRKEELAKTQ